MHVHMQLMIKGKQFESVFNPFTPKSDQHLISPYNINPESHITVMRIEKMVTREETFRLANKFSLSAP